MDEFENLKLTIKAVFPLETQVIQRLSGAEILGVINALDFDKIASSVSEFTKRDGENLLLNFEELNLLVIPKSENSLSAKIFFGPSNLTNENLNKDPTVASLTINFDTNRMPTNAFISEGSGKDPIKIKIEKDKPNYTVNGKAPSKEGYTQNNKLPAVVVTQEQLSQPRFEPVVKVLKLFVDAAKEK